MSDGFVVVAEFDLPAGQVEAFLPLVRDNATASVRDEPGCRRFDVLVPERNGEESCRIVLYEIYRDAAAFDEHLHSPHFKTFQTAALPFVTGRALRRFDLHENAKSV